MWHTDTGMGEIERGLCSFFFLPGEEMCMSCASFVRHDFLIIYKLMIRGIIVRKKMLSNTYSSNVSYTIIKFLFYNQSGIFQYHAIALNVPLWQCCNPIDKTLREGQAPSLTIKPEMSVCLFVHDLLLRLRTGDRYRIRLGTLVSMVTNLLPWQLKYVILGLWALCCAPLQWYTELRCDLQWKGPCTWLEAVLHYQCGWGRVSVGTLLAVS